MKKLALTFVFGLGLAAAGTATAPASVPVGAPAAGGGGGGFACPDVWKPVICSDGNVYSNSCYASLAGASGCVPYGGDAS